MTTKYSIDIPYVLGLIATRSFNRSLDGIVDIIERGKIEIKEGMIAYGALKTLQKDPNNAQAKALFERYGKYLGYGLLLKKYTEQVTDATEEQVNLAANDLKPKVLPMFISFRIMVACGLYLIFLFGLGFYLSLIHKLHLKRWYHRMAFYSLPVPWIAAELGWVVAEYGRQPWSVQGILPTFMGASSITSGQVMTSIAGFVLFYTILAIVEVFLMVKYIRLGPDGLQAIPAH